MMKPLAFTMYTIISSTNSGIWIPYSANPMPFISFSWLIPYAMLLVTYWIKAVSVDENTIGHIFYSHLQYGIGCKLAKWGFHFVLTYDLSMPYC